MMGYTRETAEFCARSLIRLRKNFGDEFKPGALEEITQAFMEKKDLSKIAEVADSCILPKGIEMPWGGRVNP